MLAPGAAVAPIASRGMFGDVGSPLPIITVIDRAAAAPAAST